MIGLKQRVGNKIKVMSKLEKPSAVQDLEAVVKASDGIMVGGTVSLEMVLSAFLNNCRIIFSTR